MASPDSITGGVSKNSGRSKKPIQISLFIILVVLLLFGAYALWNHFHNSNNGVIERAPPVTAQQYENAKKAYVSDFAKNGDFNSYQIVQRSLAQQYLLSDDSKDAVRVMNEVFKNVPAEKVNSSSYIVMVNAQKAAKDSVEYKRYLQLLIVKLNAEGDAATAAIYQKELDGI